MQMQVINRFLVATACPTRKSSQACLQLNYLSQPSFAQGNQSQTEREQVIIWREYNLNRKHFCSLFNL